MLEINSFMDDVDIDNTLLKNVNLISLRVLEIYFFNKLLVCDDGFNNISLMKKIHDLLVDKDYFNNKDINPIECDSLIDNGVITYSDDEMSSFFSSMHEADFIKSNVIENKNLIKDLIKRLEMRFDYVYKQITIENSDVFKTTLDMINDAFDFMDENIQIMGEGINIIAKEKGVDSNLLKITIDSYNRSVATFLDSYTRAFMVCVLSYDHLYIIDLLNKEKTVSSFKIKIVKFSESIKNHAILNLAKSKINKYFLFDDKNDDFVINGLSLMNNFIADRNSIIHQTDPVLRKMGGIVSYYNDYCDFLYGFIERYIINDDSAGKIAMKNNLIKKLTEMSTENIFLEKSISILREDNELNWMEV
ncbi:hypothetical protein H4Q82_03510 [Pectobacterium carotovorum subsp. carotovorum]|uniref:hypothetical protein n=1 Tax=Pectobacterium carotovorum TaxID=554 RepID=UPI0015FEFA40|nr:hypothetical protein [Pectobacterium carotovorum]MBB1525564.1 hypothetical protein [Pectobacterium carotovorum subsp. carotovorum]